MIFSSATRVVGHRVRNGNCLWDIIERVWAMIDGKISLDNRFFLPPGLPYQPGPGADAPCSFQLQNNSHIWVETSSPTISFLRYSTPILRAHFIIDLFCSPILAK